MQNYKKKSQMYHIVKQSTATFASNLKSPIMILDSDTNVCYVSLLMTKHKSDMDLLCEIAHAGVDLELLDYTRDIWARDYMPVQIAPKKFFGFEYAPDYLYNDEYVNTITSQARVCDRLDVETIPSGLIIDGGNVVKTSKGVIMVDKIFQENDHYSKIALINKLENYFACESIFLPWDRVEIYGHADGIVREINPGQVMMTNYHRFSKRFAEQYQQILSRHH